MSTYPENYPTPAQAGQCQLHKRWPNLIWTDSGRERFHEVHELVPNVETWEAFVNLLDYLNEYGGPVSEEDQRRRFRITIAKDFAYLSFSLWWDRLDTKTGEYVGGFNGGLIYHGGNNDPLCVSIIPQIWGIHT